MPVDDTQALRDELNAFKLSASDVLARLDERTRSTADAIQTLANRPSPGVPVWVVFMLAVPSYIIGIALVILTIWRIQHGG